jgi:hypothetical protein
MARVETRLRRSILSRGAIELTFTLCRSYVASTAGYVAETTHNRLGRARNASGVRWLCARVVSLELARVCSGTRSELKPKALGLSRSVGDNAVTAVALGRIQRLVCAAEQRFRRIFATFKSC